MSENMQQISEVLTGWSKLYVVELLNYTLACMMLLEDFPEGKGTPQALRIKKLLRSIRRTF